MVHLLLIIIYLSFISLGLPDALLGSAYVGILLMPPLFGLIANHISVSLFPFYLLAILVLMTVMHEKLLRKCS